MKEGLYGFHQEEGLCSPLFFTSFDENLAANSEPLKVKIGTQGIGKISKWKFGEYEVVTSKASWTKTTSKSNLFNTKTESKTTQKFSFTLCNQLGDSALVNAAKNIELKAVQGFELFPSFFVGEKLILWWRRFGFEQKYGLDSQHAGSETKTDTGCGSHIHYAIEIRRSRISRIMCKKNSSFKFSQKKQPSMWLNTEGWKT